MEYVFNKILIAELLIDLMERALVATLDLLFQEIHVLLLLLLKLPTVYRSLVIDVFYAITDIMSKIMYAHLLVSYV